MRLTDIKDPSFLKDLSENECYELAAEIRKFLIDNISKTGGHLSSNLGIVELTIALHKVFDSPKDKIFFDVGHQSYIHKILTGRAKDFGTLRQYNGMSGFQKRCESVHDVWEAGHSSTSLSGALGMAVARDLNGDDYNVVPVIGDGALFNGMAFEALNQIGFEQRKMVIIFNDNDMSISHNIGGLTKGIAKLRASKSYNEVKDEVKGILDTNDIGHKILDNLRTIKNNFKDGIVDAGVFGEFNLEYLGPVDGHNIKDLIRALETAKKHDGPIVVHVITKKGKGYKYCEEDVRGYWHGIGPFNPKTGKPLATLPLNHLSWSEIISETLIKLAKCDEDIVAITPAMIQGSKLEKFFAQFPSRSFDCGIAEEHAMTFAAGLGISGKKPFISIYSSFLQRCYDQINHDVCRMNLPCVIGIDRAGLVGEDGETHHGVFDIALLRNIPNMVICEPKDANEAQDLLLAGFKHNGPYAIRYPRGSALVPTRDFQSIKVGTWVKEIYNKENSVTIIAYGVDVCKLQDKIKINNLDINLINARFFKPIDTQMIDEIISWNKPIVVYETDIKIGGLSSAILEYINDSNQNVHIYRIGIEDHFVKGGSINNLRKELGLDYDTLFELTKEIRG